jgi:hypothetical protein
MAFKLHFLTKGGMKELYVRSVEKALAEEKEWFMLELNEHPTVI